MAEILSRCGYRCDLCLAYRDNIAKKDQRAALQAGWKKYFDLNMNIDEIVCDGCHNCGEDAVRLDFDCPVRPCVIHRGLEHCGQCPSYPCNKFEQRRGHTIEVAKMNAGKEFRAAEFRKFVHPYDNGTRLDQLQKDRDRLSKMTNPHIKPDLAGMGKFISPPASQWFGELVEVLAAQQDLSMTIKYGGKNYGWEVNVRKGSRPIVSITPQQNAFTVLCVMGKREIETHAANKDLFSAKANKQIEATRKLHDGKWVYWRVECKKDLQDAYSLFALKRYRAKAREQLAKILP